MYSRLRAYLFITSYLFFFSYGVSGQTIVTVAGTGYHGTTGDGGPATCAGVPYPYSVVTDAAGNLYITTSNSVRKVSAATGIITTIAGNDSYGDAGDGGPAVNALLRFPYGLCIDGGGNLYISEYSGHFIRKISAATGIITTIGGNGTAGYSGDGGPATSAQLNTPQGICVDANGNVYIADLKNSRIRKITAATGIITTIGGNGIASYSGDGGLAVNAGIPYPVFLALDGAGNLYESEVAGGNTSRIRKIDKTTGIITTIAGNSSYAYSGDGGLAVNASLFDPTGICVDGNGNVYIAEYDDSRIRKITAATGIITTVAGNGTNGYSGDGGAATSAQLNNPLGICLDPSGNLYVADNQNVVVRKIYFSGAPPPNTPSNATISISTTTPTICNGQLVDFTATVTNGGAGPVYQWEKNGSPVGTNSAVFSSSTLANGDIIDCKLAISASGCTPAGSVTSNSITMAISAPTTPSISIIVNTPASICIGTPVTFTAAAVNSGAHPNYQWFLNGSNTGNNGPEYKTKQLQNGDQVQCLLSADAATPCLTAPDALSNIITVTVTATPAPSLQIVASANNVCQQTPVDFEAISQNAGANPSYEWMLNGHPVGNSTTTYFSNNLTDGDLVSCRLVPGQVTCPIPESIFSDTLTMTVKALPQIQFDPPEISILAGGEAGLHASVSGGLLSYQWNPAGELQDAATLDPVTLPLTATTSFQLMVTGTNQCTAAKSLIVKVLGKFNMPNSFTPNGDGKNDVFRIPPGTYFTLKNLSVFDRWGTKLFSTGDSGRGWDGRYQGHPSPAGTYVYIVSGSDGNGPLFFKGTVILIR